MNEWTGLLAGRVALVTGASKGLGRAIAKEFAVHGAAVAVTSLRDEPGCRETVRQIEEVGGRAFHILGDVSVPRDVDDMMDATVRNLGPIDVLVNNAALQLRESLMEASEANWDRVMASNVKSVFLCSQRVARRMMSRGAGGCIINVASHAGIRYIRGTSLHYQASKAAVLHMTRVLAAELAPYSIRVNAIAPGLVETEFTRDLLSDPDRRRQLEERIPLGRVGRPDDIVGGALFLASSLSDWMTGEALVINGGQTL